MTSFLRRRIRDDGKPSHSREETPEKAEEVRLAPVSKIVGHKKAKGGKRRNGFIFFLGGLAGIVAAGLFAKNNDLIDLPELGDLSMDSLLDVLPANFVKDARDLMVCFSRSEIQYCSQLLTVYFIAG
jgi:phospholipid:diacylglycerol acyltransferase